MRMKRNTQTPPEKRKFKKRSSAAARRLIEAAVEKYRGNESKAARALGLPNSTQLNKMRKGLLKDTPAMKAALLKAKMRANRAWHFIPEPHQQKTIDHEAVQAHLTMLDNDLSVLAELIKPA